MDSYWNYACNECCKVYSTNLHESFLCLTCRQVQSRSGGLKTNNKLEMQARSDDVFVFVQADGATCTVEVLSGIYLEQDWIAGSVVCVSRNKSTLSRNGSELETSSRKRYQLSTFCLARRCWFRGTSIRLRYIAAKSYFIQYDGKPLENTLTTTMIIIAMKQILLHTIT